MQAVVPSQAVVGSGEAAESPLGPCCVGSRLQPLGLIPNLSFSSFQILTLQRSPQHTDRGNVNK